VGVTKGWLVVNYHFWSRLPRTRSDFQNYKWKENLIIFWRNGRRTGFQIPLCVKQNQNWNHSNLFFKNQNQWFFIQVKNCPTLVHINVMWLFEFLKNYSSGSCTSPQF
jgi:hypothetical protein